jgi:transcriptional regulator with XRE-family HTH domain
MKNDVTRVLMGRRGDVRIRGSLIRERRESLFLSQMAIATKAGIGLSSLQRIERLETAAMLRSAVPALASALSMSDAEFMTQIAFDDESPSAPPTLPYPITNPDLLNLPLDRIKAMATFRKQTPADLVTEALDLLDDWKGKSKAAKGK